MKSSPVFQIFYNFDDLSTSNTFENLKSIYHYSIPNTKLFYPEPFIASPSFMHSDLWFVHILLYQYWLWFVFIFIIVFFFLTFLTTVRWCNMRIRPRRETRGVSRSKCGDLITATVPVSWATSIIVNESTDAIDYYDGFGTTELVVGIRAYQWGWEYYYPKDIDLNYNLKPNHSIFTGNSLKYQKTTDTTNQANNFWKFYQNKTFDSTLTPLFFLISSLEGGKLINFLNLSEMGLNPLFEANAFKKIKVLSKMFTNQLTFCPSSRFNSYNALNNYYENSSQYYTSHIYGSQKQQNFIANSALLNSQLTFFNAKSLLNIITSDSLFSSKTPKIEEILTVTNSLFQKISKTSNNSKFLNYAKQSILLNYFCRVNANSEQKTMHQLDLKLFNNFFNKQFIKTSTLALHKTNVLSEITLFFDLPNLIADKKLLITTKLTPFVTAFSQNIATSEKTIRNFIKISPIASALHNTPNANNLFQVLTNVHAQNKNLTHNSTSALASYSSKIFFNKLFFDFPYTPIFTAKTNASILNYDYTQNLNAETSLLLQGKEEFMPNSLLSAYWNFFFTNSDLSLKIKQLQLLNNKNLFFYLPAFALYNDYDFRNWQASELFEDALWETTYPVYNHLDYTELKSTARAVCTVLRLDSAAKLFNSKNRLNSFKDVNIIENNQTHAYLTAVNLINFEIEDSFLNTKAMRNTDLNITILNQFLNTSNDAYDASKFWYNAFSQLNKTSLMLSFSFLTNHSFSAVLDSFRSDFDEYALFADSAAKLTMQNSINRYDFTNFATYKTNFNDLIFIGSNDLKFTNNINLRNTAKNAIVTYNSMQKVFKTRFDENRSHARYTDLISSSSNLPFLSTTKVPYETMLGKNKNFFLSTIFYKNNFKRNFNLLFNTNTSLNFAFYDFPFLLALKSDSARYLWFDWFAKWGYVEIQPSSSSRYAVFGMPYFSKNFEFATSANENLNEAENYLIRISRARKNYLPNWTYTPYLYLKNLIWFKYDLVFYTNNVALDNDLMRSFFFFNLSTWYWNNDLLTGSSNTMLNPRFSISNSNTTSYARTAVFNNSSTAGYYFLLSNLADILTKREYLYRELFFFKKKILNLDLIFTNTPKNALFFEIKTCLNFGTFSELTRNKNYSRNVSYFSFTYFSNYYFKNLLGTTPLSFLDDVLVNYFQFLTDTVLAQKSDLYKNQYRPMRKGVSNMIRLHATGAIALPVEIRLQVLASSKDVIHSWAIPSAGIKIDCVPGYSSHRVMIFLVSGIYWGQCMEICGRYHHWMPIIVYFIKRDLFFLWCTHFVHTSPTAVWSANDRQFTNTSRPISFDKTSWLLEMNK